MGMIARITRILLAIQACLAIALSMWAIELWHIDRPLVATFMGFAGVLMFRIAITINNFYLASRFRSPVPEGFKLTWLQTCRLILQEFRATMWSSSWSMPFQAFDKHIATRPTELPVLLVHGYGCNSGYWQSMSKALAKACITHYAIDLEPVFGSIDDYAAVIHRAAEALCAETSRQKIVIVAHSMGGLATRAYLRDYGNAHVAKAITLGTPHHGTALARHGVGVNTAQMRWIADGAHGMSSEWLQQLRACEDDTVRALFVSIYSHHDNIISPQTSSHLPGAKNIQLRGIGHVTLALHPEVQAIVIDEILQASQTSEQSSAVHTVTEQVSTAVFRE
jgi:triacylglycerol esterase/lipase EstA (alpha/beta hydrolase family)